MSDQMDRLVDSPWLRNNVTRVTWVLTVVAYVLVLATFSPAYKYLPYVRITQAQTNLLGTVVVILNAVSLSFLLLGYYWIRRGNVRRHRASMLTAFVGILAFLLIYLEKVGGGYIKTITSTSAAVRLSYFALLGIHEFLSIVAVPVVLYAVLLGLTHAPAELPGTSHPRYGRIAVATWVASLALGILVYFILNVYAGYSFAAHHGPPI